MAAPRLLIAFLVFLALGRLLAADNPTSQPTLTDSEKQAGWILLFDGVSTDGWRGLGAESFPTNRWRIDEGCLHCLGGPGRTSDIITTRKYENFELSFEWRVPTAPGNTGVKYRVQEKKGDGFAFGPEYQIMWDPAVNDKHATASLYDVIAPQNKRLRPIDQFNESRIKVQGNHVEHWLNGAKTVEFEFNSEEVKTAVAQSKFKNTDWAKTPAGYIALQDHHDEAFFRNIKIRELKAK